MQLFLASGLADMLTCAALRQMGLGGRDDILCLGGRPGSMPSALRRESLAQAHLFGPWTAVIDAVEVSAHADSAQSARESIDLIAPAFAARQITRIVTHSLDKPLEAGVLHLYPKAEVVLIDNGLASHLTKRVYNGAWRPDRRRRIARDLLARVSAAYSVFARVLPTPGHLAEVPLHEIEPAAMRAAATAAIARGAAGQLDELRPAGASHLVLGTSFYRTGKIPFAEERRVYRELVDDLTAMDGLPILYKEHPRANREPLLSRRDGVVPIESCLPVELWAEATTIRDSFSISSSALLSLAHIYGIPGYWVGRGLQLDRAFPLLDLVRQHSLPWRGAAAARALPNISV